jgi:hypothetical protein
MEFVRRSDLDFRAGLKVAAKLGYRYVEPMVHTGWELLSEVGYYHSFSMEEDPLLMKELCQQSGLRVSSISAHSPLMKPEAAVPRLTRAILWNLRRVANWRLRSTTVRAASSYAWSPQCCGRDVQCQSNHNPLRSARRVRHCSQIYCGIWRERSIASFP